MSDAETMERPGTALAVVPKSSLPTVIAADKDDLLGKLAEKLKGFKADISTPTGREAIASTAKAVSKTKIALLKLADGLSEEARKTHKAIVAEKNIIEARLDSLRDEVRAPLTAYENEDKVRIANHEAALSALAALTMFDGEPGSEAVQQRIDQVPALSNRQWQEFTGRASDLNAEVRDKLDDMLSRAEKREAEAAELARLRAEQARRDQEAAAQAQAEREARIAAEAAERAERAAAERVAAEARRAEEAERRAAEQAAQAERDRVAAEEAAAARQAAAVEAERRRAEDAARLVRIAAEREAAAIAEADRKRAANIAHQRRINATALNALILIGVPEDMGKIVLAAIAKGEIPAVRIEY